MIVKVPQCAGTKREGAGKLQTESGKPVLFGSETAIGGPDSGGIARSS